MGWSGLLDPLMIIWANSGRMAIQVVDGLIDEAALERIKTVTAQQIGPT
jgi:hypothetical protein